MKVKIIKPTISDILKGINYGTILEVESESNGFINVNYYEEVIPFLPHQVEYI